MNTELAGQEFMAIRVAIVCIVVTACGRYSWICDGNIRPGCL